MPDHGSDGGATGHAAERLSFSPAERRRLRDQLVARAQRDARVVAAALVGSAARGAEDRWSDIDLALRLAEGVDVVGAADAWTSWLATEHDVVDHTDVWAGPALYRVFLTRTSLQVDVSFWPTDDFGARGPGFRLLFGDQARAETPGTIDPGGLVGLAWLHVLHGRSALGRGRTHQAVHVLDGLRDLVVQLACVRHGVPAHQGRGVDDLDHAWLARLARARSAAPDPEQLRRSLDALTDLLLDEVEAVDPERAGRLRQPLLADRAAGDATRPTSC